MRRIVIVSGIALVFFLAACSHPPAGERAVLDRDFGVAGWVEVGNQRAQGGDAGVVLKRDSAGRLWLAGRTCTAAESPCAREHTAAALWRFLASGEMDTNFAQNGAWVVDGIGRGNIDLVFDLAFWKGAAVLAGTVESLGGDTNLALWAIDEGGMPVPGLFGGRGYWIMDGTLASGGDEYATRLWPDGDRLWLVGGASPAGTNHYAAAWRIQADGSLDAGFDGDGIWTSAQPNRWAIAMVVDRAGRPVFGGGFDPLLWRLLPQGGLDPTFGNQGELALPMGRADTGLVRSILEMDDGYLVAGFLRLGQVRPVLWRVTAAGALDPAFGDQGLLVLPGESFYYYDDRGRFGVYGLGLAVDEEGRILVVGGVKKENGDLDLAIWRVLPEGKLDPDFCGGNACLWDSGHGNDWGASLVYEGGTLWIGGRMASAQGDYDAAVWKFKIRR